MAATETEVELEYRLSAEQRELWRRNLPNLEGKQTQIAKRLHALAKGTLGSWKNVVSGFSKGEAGHLRSVFEHPERASIVAETLRLSVDDLRLRLRTAREHCGEIQHGWRIPGFEDLGVFPILDALYPCPGGRSSGAGSLWTVPDWSLEGLFELARSEPGKEGRIVALIDELGLDAKPALRWLEAKLEQGERPATDWRDPNLHAGSVVLQPDFDALSDTERSTLLSRVRATQATVFVSTTIDDPGTHWPPDSVIYQPGRGSVYWAAEYLKHLQAFLSRHGFSVDFSQLRDWLEDDPRSAWAVERAHSLGVVARHVFDARPLPFTNNDLLTISIERARAWLEHRGLLAEAVLVGLCGQKALGLMAADMCVRDEPELSYEAVARYFVGGAAGIAGPKEWEHVAVSGMIGVVQELVESGVLRERGGLLSTAQHQLSVVALGHHLAQHLDDVALVEKAATTPRWQGAFLAAAEARRDPSPIIDVLMRCSVGVRHVAIPALTMVLECDAHPSNAAAFRRAHLTAINWWASRPLPPPQQTRNIYYGRMWRQSALPSSTFQLGGRSALVALGQTSLRRRDVLAPVAPAMLLELEIDRAQAALGHTRLDDERARAALLIGAPFQIADFCDPQPWRSDVRLDDPRRDPTALGLSNQDYALWWRTVAVPRLREEPDSDARLIGVKPGFSIAVAMRQNERGTKIWSDALAGVLASSVEGAQQAFASAVAQLVDGGRLNFEAIKSLWERIDPGIRSNVQREVRVRLEQRRNTYWCLGDDEAAWVMREFLDCDSMQALWTAWERDNQVRWRPFLMADFPPSRILDWALDHADEFTPDVMDPVFADLLGETDLEFLVEMELRVPMRWYARVHWRLREFDHEQVDRVRLSALQRCPTDEIRREILAREIDPRVGDEQIWCNLADSETKELERLIRLVQADLASRREDPWRHTPAIIARLAEMLESPLEYPDHERSMKLLMLLGQGLKRSDPPPGREAILRQVFDSPRVRSCISGGMHWPWWAVAIEIFGEPYLLDVLRAGHEDDDGQATLTRLRSIALSRSSLIALAGDARLGPSAATILADQITDSVLKALSAEEITTLLTDPGLDPESNAVRALVSSYLATRPQNLEPLTAIMQRRLEPEARMTWWRDLANQIEDPHTLAVLLDAMI